MLKSGIFFALLSGFLLTIVAALARYLGQDFHPFQVAFMRNITALLLILPFMNRQRFKTKRIKLHTIRGVIGGTAMLLWFYSLALLPLAEATALSFTSPLFATIGAALILGETVRSRRWTAIAIGFVGVIFMLRPIGLVTGMVNLEPGVFYGLAAALMMAVSILMIHSLAQGENLITMLFYMAFFMSIVSGIAAAPVWQMPTATFIGGAFIMGTIGLCGNLSLNKAFSLSEASLIMPFDFARLPYAAFIGFVAFKELPNIYTVIGGSTIMLSSLYLMLRERQLKKSITPVHVPE